MRQLNKDRCKECGTETRFLNRFLSDGKTVEYYICNYCKKINRFEV
jgi:hypothetical protein